MENSIICSRVEFLDVMTSKHNCVGRENLKIVTKQRRKKFHMTKKLGPGLPAFFSWSWQQQLIWIYFAGFPVLEAAQTKERCDHDGERWDGCRLPRLFREPPRSVYRGGKIWDSGGKTPVQLDANSATAGGWLVLADNHAAGAVVQGGHDLADQVFEAGLRTGIDFRFRFDNHDNYKTGDSLDKHACTRASPDSLDWGQEIRGCITNDLDWEQQETSGCRLRSCQGWKLSRSNPIYLGT